MDGQAVVEVAARGKPGICLRERNGKPAKLEMICSRAGRFGLTFSRDSTVLAAGGVGWLAEAQAVELRGTWDVLWPSRAASWMAYLLCSSVFMVCCGDWGI